MYLMTEHSLDAQKKKKNEARLLQFLRNSEFKNI